MVARGAKFTFVKNFGGTKRNAFLHSRKIRRGKATRKILFFSFSVIIVFSSVVVLFRSKYARVDSITVSGNETVGSEEITEAARRNITGSLGGLFPKDSILLFQRNKVASDIEKAFPKIKAANIAVTLSGKLKIDVEEREVSGLYCEEGELCAFVDADGYVFQMAPAFSEGVYFIIQNSSSTGLKIKNEFQGFSLINGDKFKELMDFKKKAAGLGVNFARMSSSGENVYEFTAKEGWYAKVSDSTDLNQTLINLNLILNNKVGERRGDLEYVDFRFGDKLFYKFKDL